MKQPKPTKKNKPITAAEKKPRFHNYPYHAETSRTEVGSPIIKIVPKDPRATSAHPRRLAVFLYDLASEMERRSEELNAKWVISVEAWSARIMVELATGMSYERERADDFVARLLADHHLA